MKNQSVFRRAARQLAAPAVALLATSLALANVSAGAPGPTFPLAAPVVQVAALPNQPGPAACMAQVPFASVLASVESSEGTGFWHVGLAGVCKARSVWWGRLLAVLFHLCGLVQAPLLMKAQVEMLPAELREAAAPSLLFSGLLGGAFGYILLWGLPAGPGGWILCVLCALFAGGAGAAAGQAASARC